MNSFNPRTLKQILRHEIVANSLMQMAQQLGTAFHIIDQQGKTLAGDEQLFNENRVAIRFAHDTIAWLIAPQHASILATSLEAMIALEMEKKSVAADGVQMYREINMLFHLHESVEANLNLSEVCNSLIGEVCRLINCEASLIFLAESNQLQLAAGNSLKHRAIQDIDAGIIGQIYTSGVADIFNQVARAPCFDGETDYPAMMCAPLKTSDNRIGILVAAGSGPFSANDLKLLTTLASHGAIVLRNAQLYTELHEMFQSTVSVLAETIEKRDPYTAGHTQRVTDYSVMIAHQLGLPLNDISNLRLSAILHDVGKIGVRDHILLKTTQLEPDEVEKMKLHTEHGADILNCSQLLHNIVDGVRYHHERFDGRGYNHGISGLDIPLHARIIAVADAFDAMTTDRPYRLGMDFPTAIGEINNGAGSQFDPAIVEAFLVSLTTQLTAISDLSNQTGIPDE
jgi:HD-GYP domain-containing protein (c-di-GMP phosphodiesterase class II)